MLGLELRDPGPRRIALTLGLLDAAHRAVAPTLKLRDPPSRLLKLPVQHLAQQLHQHRERPAPLLGIAGGQRSALAARIGGLADAMGAPSVVDEQRERLQAQLRLRAPYAGDPQQRIRRARVDALEAMELQIWVLSIHDWRGCG
ncbi:MAG: hypothetical protein WKF48_01985 [Solirubrobacteraceae bacterium]